jgi:thioester reductase-like protein
MMNRSISESFSGKHILVTGVTGFLGKVWLAMLLDELPEVRKFTILARGQKGIDAKERFERIYEASPAFRPLREKLGQGVRALIADKVDVIDAPLSKPLCGMSEDTARTLMADVDIVVHFAGLTDFEPDPSHALEANVRGAMHVADLAALSPSKRYVHCSTCFVAGKRSGEITETLEVGVSPNGVVFDPETELLAIEKLLGAEASKSRRVDIAMTRAHALGFPNIYTYTKALAEHLIELRHDVKSTTVRPAIVECARRFPFTGWNEGVNTSAPLVWLLSTTFRALPARPTLHFDVVPVDTVARAMTIATAAALEDRAEKIYHVASSHENPLTFERALELTNLKYRKVHRGESDPFTRHVLSRLDTVAVNPDRAQLLGVTRMRKLSGELRTALKPSEVKRRLPPKLWEKHADRFEDRLKTTSMKLRTTERKLSSIEEMLRQFRPFIYDFHYTFRTDALSRATANLSPADREKFGFDISSLDWRHYWMEVQIPGLETWSIPVLRGEKVYDDPPLPKAHEPVAHEMQVVGITVQA